MGLMDKVKAQATQLAQKTQETARDSKAKFDQAQGKRHGDAMLRNLGALVYAERTGRGAPESQQQVDKLVADISAFEAENGINLAAQSADQPADDSPGAAAPADPPAAPASRYPSPSPDFGTAPSSRYTAAAAAPPSAASPPAADFVAPPAASPPVADFGAPPAGSPAPPPPAADFGAPPAGSPAPPPPVADFGAPPAGSPAPPPPAADFGAPPAAAYPSAPEPPDEDSQQS